MTVLFSHPVRPLPASGAGNVFLPQDSTDFRKKDRKGSCRLGKCSPAGTNLRRRTGPPVVEVSSISTGPNRLPESHPVPLTKECQNFAYNRLLLLKNMEMAERQQSGNGSIRNSPGGIRSGVIVARGGSNTVAFSAGWYDHHFPCSACSGSVHCLFPCTGSPDSFPRSLSPDNGQKPLPLRWYKPFPPPRQPSHRGSGKPPGIRSKNLLPAV